jgi:hypothetical protein
MCNDTQLGEMIRGRLATIKFVGGGDFIKGFEVYGQKIAGGPVKPTEDVAKPVYTYDNPMSDPKAPKNATYHLWENFLSCVREKKRETLSTPELGAAAFSTVNMGAQSYRKGKVFFWDKSKREPVDADGSWATKLEARSKKRDKPSQIIGWHGGDSGSVLVPPEYQKLEGPWIDGKDPAGA